MAKVTPTLGRIHTVVEGDCPSLEYRVKFLYDDGAGEVTRISPWHDVPYKNPEDGSYNMVVRQRGGGVAFVRPGTPSPSSSSVAPQVEIPKWTRAKFEIATGELYNPIKQDVKNGTLREYYYGCACCLLLRPAQPRLSPWDLAGSPADAPLPRAET